MFDKLIKVFDFCSEAVVISKDGEIVFLNASAKNLFGETPKIEKPEDIFPQQLLEHDSESFVGTAEIGENLMDVVVTRVDEYRIFCIMPTPPGEMESISNMLSIVAGSMSDPVTRINMASSILLPQVEGMNNDRLSEYAAIINHGNFAMRRLLGNIKYLSRSFEEIRVSKKRFNLVSMLKALVESIQILVEERQIEISFVSKSDEIIIYADAEMMEQMVLNLLSNSLKYTEPGGKITLSAKTAGGRVLISVADTGCGISQETLMSVWNRYGSTKKMTDTKSGAGLGLHIVQKIARLHDGSAVIESREGEGTTATVLIPVSEQCDTFMTGISVLEPSGMSPLLVELSDVLDYKYYSKRFMD